MVVTFCGGPNSTSSMATAAHTWTASVRMVSSVRTRRGAGAQAFQNAAADGDGREGEQQNGQQPCDGLQQQVGHDAVLQPHCCSQLP